MKHHTFSLWQRLFCLLLSLILLFLCTGCTETKTEVTTEAEPEITDIYLTFSMNTDSVPDLDRVIEKVNEITIQELNIRVHIVPISIMEQNEELLSLISRDQPVDVMVMLNILPFIESGYALPLDDLLKAYGQHILAESDESYMSLAKVDGVQYSIIKNRELAIEQSVCMRTDLLEKYSIDPESIQSWDDFEGVLETLKNGGETLNLFEPKIVLNGDNLGDSIGVLLGDVSVPTIVNHYETTEFLTQIKRIRRWRLAGYISGDGINSNSKQKARLQEMMSSGNLFAFAQMSKPGINVQEGIAVGYTLSSFPITMPVLTTTSVFMQQWGICSKSAHPKEAMQLLDFLYTNEAVANLICWGIEGEHYIVRDDGSINYPSGVSAANTGYNFDRNWQVPGRYIARTWAGDHENLKEEIERFNDTAQKSVALGFIFDPTPVKEVYQAVRDIVNAYLDGFLRGNFDVDTVYPQFIDALKEAGIDTIIAEKQRQLNAYLAVLNNG